ncbi:MAG: hypothetical protein ACTSV3_03205 [Candidatus Thorarchaeota archaeon]|nr:MAG: hypothetical protein DRP09_01810 [Candidatus Thorarchaeota archaeon]
MTEESDRPRIIRAIKKCLFNADEFFEKAMDSLDEIGRSSVGTGITPLIGGYALPNAKTHYREAIIAIDSGEKALAPLVKRFRDGRVNVSHFKSDEAITVLEDLAGVDFNMLISNLLQNRGRESSWYRLKEVRGRISEALNLVAES